MPDYVPYNTVDECQICERMVPVREFGGRDRVCHDCDSWYMNLEDNPDNESEESDE